MDDFKKNGDITQDSTENMSGLPENAETLDSAPQEQEAPARNADSQIDELTAELEQIREMFQTELDKAQNGEDDSQQELIQELDEIPDEESEDGKADADEAVLCSCCGEKARDTSFGEDYPYCADCRKLMQHNPLNWFAVITVVIMIGLTALSYYMVGGSLGDFTVLVSADEAYSEKKLVDAAYYYQEYFNENISSTNVSMKAVKNMITAMADLGYYSDSQTLIDEYFSEAELSRPWNAKYREISTEYNLLVNTSTIINEAIGEALNGIDLNYDENMEKLDAIIEENKETGAYSEPFLEYGKFLLMLVNKESNETQLAQLQKIEQVDGAKHPWIYLTYIMNLAGNMGDTELAKKYFDICMDINVQEMTMYNYYANAYRFCDEPDPEMILSIAEQAAKNYSSNTTPDFYKSYAIAYLLQENGEAAIKSIEQYLQNCQPSVSDFNLYALCAAYIKDDDTYNYVKGILEQSGYEIGSSVKKYKNGKMTLVEVLTEKGGDI